MGQRMTPILSAEKRINPHQCCATIVNSTKYTIVNNTKNNIVCGVMTNLAAMQLPGDNGEPLPELKTTIKTTTVNEGQHIIEIEGRQLRQSCQQSQSRQYASRGKIKTPCYQHISLLLPTPLSQINNNVTRAAVHMNRHSLPLLIQNKQQPATTNK